MSTERVEGYREALSNVRSTIQRRLSEDSVSEDGKLELSNLVTMLGDMLRPNLAVAAGPCRPWKRTFAG